MQGIRYAVLLAAILGGCTTSLPASPPASEQGIPLRPTATAALIPSSGPSAAPIPTIPPAPLDLPSPGGTCTADQLTVSKVLSGYSNSTIMSRVAYVIWVMGNTGPDCELVLPKVVGLAAASGVFGAVNTVNQGQQVCHDNACKTVYPTSFKIRSGHTFSLELRASWFNEPSFEAAGQTPPPCGDAILGVTRADFPLASGSVNISWPTAFERICGSGPQTGIYVGFNDPPLGVD